jgi:hypothetical protein
MRRANFEDLTKAFRVSILSFRELRWSTGMFPWRGFFGSNGICDLAKTDTSIIV